jgi:hypothetical protein
MTKINLTINGRPIEELQWDLPVGLSATTTPTPTTPTRDWMRERDLVEAAYADYLAAIKHGPQGIPHCDELVLHAPGDCVYCDKYPTRQQARLDMGILFTDEKGYAGPTARPCPATLLRPVETIERWYGNVPTTTA